MMFLLPWLECYNDFKVVCSLTSRSPNSIFWLSWAAVSIVHFLFQFSGQLFTWSSFNVFLYSWCMSIENFILFYFISIIFSSNIYFSNIYIFVLLFCIILCLGSPSSVKNLDLRLSWQASDVYFNTTYKNKTQ